MTNQEILKKFIDREELLCQTALVDEMLSKDIFQWDDIENGTYYMAYNEDGQDIYFNSDEARDEARDEAEEAGNEELVDLIDESEQEYKDIFEWWHVNKYFADVLCRHGEPILRNEYGTWWGRTTSGQAIYMDMVINKIAEGMEILNGQKHEWQ